MDDLPELPFEKVLSYLSLEDRLKARAVSRRWYHQINRFKVKTLCYSQRPAGFIYGKGRWVSGAFAQNFISSSRFKSFFNTFGSTIFSNLKHLRICDLALNEASKSFVSILNMFGRLEELDIILFVLISSASAPDEEVELNLPMLASIHLERVERIDQLTLDTPRLKRVKLLACSPLLRLKLVHVDSVEWLATDVMTHVEMKYLKSLKYLYNELFSKIDSTFLSGLKQLKEVHTLNRVSISKLFAQKRRYACTNLKIFFHGFLLNGPDDPFLLFRNFEDTLVYLIKNPSRLADEIPIRFDLPYAAPEGVVPGSEINIFSRFTDLKMISANSRIPVQDVQRFLDLLKNVPNIVQLEFSGDHPQDLFDRLPEHSAVQYLFIECPVSDFRFLYRLEHLVDLQYCHQITTEIVRKAFEKLPFLRVLQFQHHNQKANIVKRSPKRWTVSIGDEMRRVADLNAVIQLVFG